MVERNLCKESGCNAACCKNLGMTTHLSDVPQSFPQAELRGVELKIENPEEEGVYYTEHYGPFVYVKIIGNCPNLTREGACNIYETRPQACKNFRRGSPVCNELRNQEGIPTFRETPPGEQI